MEEGGGGRGRGSKSALWVTDCTVMPDCHKLVVGTTSQELSFYDTTTPTYRCQYRIQGSPALSSLRVREDITHTNHFSLVDLPSVPLCIAYHCSSEVCTTLQICPCIRDTHCRCYVPPQSPSYLLYGDVSGSVVVLTFRRPVSGFFLPHNKEEEDSTQIITFSVR